MRSNKKWQCITLVILGISLVLALTKCEKQKNFKYISNPPNPDIGMNVWEFIQKKDSFSLMKKAIERAGLRNYYDQKEGKTFILPLNEAFRAYVEDNGYASISEIPVPILKYVLLYHIVDNEVLTSDTGLVKTDPQPYETENGQKMYLSHNNNYQLIINEGTSRNWTIQVSNLEATNGVIQISPAVVYYSAAVPEVENPDLQRDTVEAIQDGYVNNGWKKTENYSNENLIKVKNVGADVEGGIYDRRAFLMFDLNDLKSQTGLSNKKWDKGLKGLRKKDLATVNKTAEGLFVEILN